MTSRFQAPVTTSFSTARLLLRCPEPGDAEAYFAAMQESLAEVRPWFDTAREETLAGCEDRMRDAQARFLARQSFEFLIFLKHSSRLLGRVSLGSPNWDTPSFEVGYMLRTSATGHGWMTEAVIGLTGWAIRELGANRLAIFCNEKNIRSRNVALRAGYRFEGTHINDCRHFRTGELVNACVFSFTPEMNLDTTFGQDAR